MLYFSDGVHVWRNLNSTADLLLEKSAITGGASDMLQLAKATYSVIIKDVKKIIDAEKPKQKPHARGMGESHRVCTRIRFPNPEIQLGAMRLYCGKLTCISVLPHPKAKRIFLPCSNAFARVGE